MYYGCVWERMIRFIWKILGSLVKEKMFNDESFEILICEVESIINGRFLIVIFDD